jgi:proteasome lid subunit RPN8/RPN11
LSTPIRLVIPRGLYEDMVAQAVKELPNECCGFLAGRVVPDLADQTSSRSLGEVVERFPLVNEAASPKEYLSERGNFEAHREIRRRGLDILAVYHSHPASDPVPSRKDLERNGWGSALVHLIISLKTEELVVRGWHLLEREYREADWRIV